MRRITLIIIHCSATPEGRSLDFETCRNDHIRHRGFRDIGYHFYITRDGTIHPGRPLEQVGAHCRNHNRHSIGICYEGGLSGNGRPADTRTLPQKGAMLALLRELKRIFSPCPHRGPPGPEPAERLPLLRCSKGIQTCDRMKNGLQGMGDKA